MFAFIFNNGNCIYLDFYEIFGNQLMLYAVAILVIRLNRINCGNFSDFLVDSDVPVKVLGLHKNDAHHIYFG